MKQSLKQYSTVSHGITAGWVFWHGIFTARQTRKCKAIGAWRPHLSGAWRPHLSGAWRPYLSGAWRPHFSGAWKPYLSGAWRPRPHLSACFWATGDRVVARSTSRGLPKWSPQHGSCMLLDARPPFRIKQALKWRAGVEANSVEEDGGEENGGGVNGPVWEQELISRCCSWI
eukprot:366557-Chlamydomonas_euryale.AAC.7